MGWRRLAEVNRGTSLSGPHVATIEGHHPDDREEHGGHGESRIAPRCRSIHKWIAPEGPVPGRDVTPWCEDGTEWEERQDEIAGSDRG